MSELHHHSHSQHHHHGHHSHGHHHHSHRHHLSRAFTLGIALNFLFVVIEVIVGLNIRSLSLLSDAGHNLADVASLALSLLAFKLAYIPPTERYTYGYRKTSILVALFNAIVLLISIGAISYEAIHRFLHPEPLPGMTIAIVAGIGIVINSGTALLFMRGKDHDLNARAAYLHLASDAVVSLALVIGGVIIYYTGYYSIDAVLSLVVAGVIVVSTWSLLKESIKLSLDGVPDGIDVQSIKQMLAETNGVKEVHHIHIWAISTTVNALTAHLVLDVTTTHPSNTIKKRIKDSLLAMNIHHATLETEAEGESCETSQCDEGTAG